MVYVGKRHSTALILKDQHFQWRAPTSSKNALAGEGHRSQEKIHTRGKSRSHSSGEGTRASRGKVKRTEEQMKGSGLGSGTFREVKFKLAGAPVWQQSMDRSQESRRKDRVWGECQLGSFLPQ